MANPETLIDNARTEAAKKSEEAKAYTDAGIDAAQEEAQLDEGLYGGALTDLDPPPYDPSPYLTTQWDNDFANIWKDLEDWITRLMNGYMDQYFPKVDACVQITEDNWLCSVISDGYMGIPQTVETQIWERSRSREIIDANRLEREAIGAWAARGFSMPQGALLAQVYTAQANAADKNSTHSREVAIKHMDITVHMTEVAIENMTKLRIGMADALANYIRGWLALPQAAADIAKMKWDLNKYLRDSAAAYYNAMVGELSVQANYDVNISNILKDQRLAELHSRDLRISRQVDSAMKAAEGMAAQAASALGAQNTLVGSIATASSGTTA